MMATSLRTAGLLQYSKPIYEEIESYLLKIYASLFVPSLEHTIKQAGQKLEQIQKTVARTRKLSDRLASKPKKKDFQELVDLLTPLAMIGVFGAQGVNLKELALALEAGDGQKVAALLENIKTMMTKLEKEADASLDQQAKGMRADLEQWKEHYDAEFTAELEKDFEQKKPLEPLTIKLTRDHFPFLQGKFEDNVRKVRGEDAGLFDEMKEMKVAVSALGPGRMGVWSGEDGVLVVGLPDLAPMKHVLAGMRQTIRHELTHATQSVMADALGVKHLRRDEKGNFIPVYRPGPGMGPKETLDPDIHQAFGIGDDEVKKRIKKLRKYEKGGTLEPKQKKELDQLVSQRELRHQVLTSRGLESGESTYSLDDLEFYTHLADRVWEFQDTMGKLDLSPEEKELARDLWTARKWIPKDDKKAEAWVTKHDPHNAVWPHFGRTSPFFRHLKKYKPDKYKKAIKEFTKAAEPALADPKEGVAKQWEEFLEERYDGGKKQVPNPNSKTREQHPDISVNYLMKQTDPAYSSARAKLRKEFAGWRSTRGEATSIFTQHFGVAHG